MVGRLYMSIQALFISIRFLISRSRCDCGRWYGARGACAGVTAAEAGCRVRVSRWGVGGHTIAARILTIVPVVHTITTIGPYSGKELDF